MREELPKKGDEKDRRCGLLTNRRGDHKLQKGDLDWCSGCRFYICEQCSLNLSLMGSHDVMEHLDDPEAEEDEEPL